MDLTQASQMLKWMDEERRKDKAQITALQERLDGQAEQIARQEEMIATLQRSIASLETLPGRISEFSKSLEQLRMELVNAIEVRDEQHRKEHRETERTRQLEIGALRDEISRVADSIRPIPRLDERISAMAAEQNRFQDTLQKLDAVVKDQGQRFEDRLQSVVYLEEQRRADHQRLVEVEKVWPKLQKRIETVAAKLPLIEDALPKLRTRLEEGLKPIEEFEGIIEELRVSDFRRNQEVKKWLDQAAEVQEELQELREERQRFLNDYRDVQDALKTLDPFQERIQTRQNEALERQRVMEERIKRQWEEWQGKQEKERRNWEVEVGERWRQQLEYNERQRKRLDEIEPMIKFYLSQLQELWEARRLLASRLLENAQDEYEAMNTEVDEQLAAFRDYIEPQKRI
jgi:chromosome segregation ATPase